MAPRGPFHAQCDALRHRLLARSNRQGCYRAKRGLEVMFWQNETGGEQRLFTGVGNHLYALDPKSGQTIRSFGQNGSIHLGTGLDVEGTPGVGLNTPGVTYKDLLIIGGLGGPGAVRAFDVRNRSAALDIPSDSTSGRIRLRYLARRGLQNRHRPHAMVRSIAGRKAWDCLRPHQDGGTRFLRRQSSRDESLREQPGRPRRLDGKAAVALPDRPPRPAGQGPAVSSGSIDGDPRWQKNRRRGPRHQARPVVRV